MALVSSVFTMVSDSKARNKQSCRRVWNG